MTPAPTTGPSRAPPLCRLGSTRHAGASAHAIAGWVGTRALLKHTINDDEAARFYRRFGSLPSPLTEQK